MRHFALPCLATLLLLLSVSPARSGEAPEAIIARAVEALGGEANLTRARAVQAKMKGTIYDPGMKDSFPRGVTFTGELSSQLPSQQKISMDIDLGGQHLLLVQVLNGRKAWTRDNENCQEENEANRADRAQAAYVDYVSSLVPLLKDKGYTLSVPGEAQVKGQAAHIVKVVSQGHPDVLLYFDKDSGLLLKTEHRRRDPSTNKEVKYEELFRDYQELNAAPVDERTLTAAKMGTDDAALLELLRKQTLSEETRKKIKERIRGLGDASFPVRQKAKEDLVAQGPAAVPLLTQALTDPDPEVTGLAKQCLQAIGKVPDLTVTLAAVRLLAVRKPAGAVEVLLGYLPSAPNEAAAQEVRAALAAVAFREGKPDPALVQALKDKDPQRQAAAAAVLRAGGNAAAEPPGQRLFLPGFKYATKGEVLQNDKKYMEYELSDIQIFNRLADSVFSKP